MRIGKVKRPYGLRFQKSGWRPHLQLVVRILDGWRSIAITLIYPNSPGPGE